ncbi:aspartate carbamoyltransferase catalytic subunit [Dethiosulfovibrio sp. F2B]|uniref:aspartate carbamoyltransferase catalytic subunit n=1 Tax=Dethiosulfovibrio faecalis TaxID=2720018 RepID=UPI001F373F63|nr:aspartate carbamoyltransferase catalytic subunit [Dethiosulfovibrio faecalis]MCF4150355.1 aspartate carbamoyltransferase catalytic subunit [Dethiosulfovibrio faecalis]
MSWSRRNLFDLEDWDRRDFEVFLELASKHKASLDSPKRRGEILRGRTVVNLFFEPSTRTRTSFEMAEQFLGAEVINWASSGSSLSKGETLRDTAWTLKAMGIDSIVMRHGMAGFPMYLGKLLPDVSIINGGDGARSHPTQALLDLLSAYERLGGLDGVKMVVAGDVKHSRVARSVAKAFRTMGASISFSGPRSLMPSDLGSFGVSYRDNAKKAMREARIVYLLRIQRERQDQGLFPSFEEYHRFFGASREDISEGAVVMHPGPINRGVEIASDVADGPNSLILDQVRSGVAARMAVLELCLGGEAL